MSTLTYTLRRQSLQVGPCTLSLDLIAELDKTIDDLFALLEKQGRPDLLESLCPYFGVIWPSALGLAEALTQRPAIRLHGVKVLELGCGLAIPSLIAATLGARVTAADFHPEVPIFLERNIRLNPAAQADGSLTYRAIDWMKVDHSERQFDLVIASDVLYERHYPKPVAQALTRWVKCDGEIWLADPGRPHLQEFSDEMKRLGWTGTPEIRSVHVPNTDGNTSLGPAVREIFLLKFLGAARAR